MKAGEAEKVLLFSKKKGATFILRVLRNTIVSARLKGFADAENMYVLESYVTKVRAG